MTLTLDGLVTVIVKGATPAMLALLTVPPDGAGGLGSPVGVGPDPGRRERFARVGVPDPRWSLKAAPLRGEARQSGSARHEAAAAEQEPGRARVGAAVVVPVNADEQIGAAVSVGVPGVRHRKA